MIGSGRETDRGGRLRRLLHHVAAWRWRAVSQPVQAAAAATALVVFIADCLTPAEFVVGVFYLVALVLASQARSRQWLLGVGLATVGFTALAGVLGAPPLAGTSEAMWVNRGLTAVALLGVILILDRMVVIQRDEELLRREVDHRAKNILAVVLALLRVVPRDDPQRCAVLMEGRIRSIARVHSLLAEERWEGADLRALMRRELEPYADASGRIRLQGPEVQLRPAFVQPIVMFLHELASNAAKLGAFSVPDGCLSLSWTIDPGNADLRVEWDEAGGPVIRQPPERAGFGTRLMASLAKQLGARVEQVWQSTGFRCLITVPCESCAEAR